MFNSLCHKGNVNQNYTGIPPHPSQKTNNKNADKDVEGG
jgi:hypothetical protein